MNVVVLQGNLTHDPEIKFVDGSNGKVAICNFSLAINRHFRTANGEKQKETTFIDCEVWSGGAETIHKYVRKGNSLLVRGSLKNDTWQNADGQKRSKIRVRVEDFELPPKRYNSEDVATDNATDNVVDNVVEDVETENTTPQETSVEPQDGDDIPF